MGPVALVTGTGNENSIQLHLVLFQALPVPVTRAINPHIEPTINYTNTVTHCKGWGQLLFLE